jgi:ABC-type multidrug transport system ATPase subunit
MLVLIERLAKDEGVTVLLASHLLHQVQAVCDRVAIFVRGKVVAQGTPHDLAAVDHGKNIRVEFRLGGAELDAGALAPTVSGLVSGGADVIGVHRLDEDLETIYRRYFEVEEEEVSA